MERVKSITIPSQPPLFKGRLCGRIINPPEQTEYTLQQTVLPLGKGEVEGDGAAMQSDSNPPEQMLEIEEERRH